MNYGLFITCDLAWTGKWFHKTNAMIKTVLRNVNSSLSFIYVSILSPFDFGSLLRKKCLEPWKCHHRIIILAKLLVSVINKLGGKCQLPYFFYLSWTAKWQQTWSLFNIHIRVGIDIGSLSNDDIDPEDNT